MVEEKEYGKLYPKKFDKVLLDAPCSGEGRFIGSEAKTYRNWSERTVKDLVKVQKKLFKSAYEALKDNGIMVYSTCTLNKEENEEILNWAIENLGVKLLDIEFDIKDKLPIYSDNLDKNIQKAIKILPTKSQEGFFIAKLIKNYKAVSLVK